MSGSRLEKLSTAKAELARGCDARKRLELLFDEGSFVELDSFVKSGVITGCGAVEGTQVYAFSQDGECLGGAMDEAQGDKIKKVYQLALATGCPVVGIHDSKGASLADAPKALAAYGELLQLSNNLSGVVPQIAVVAGVCAGTAAMLACSADLVVMSEKAELFLTPPFTAQAAGQGVAGAGSAENAAKAGVVHLTAPDADAAVGEARKLLSLLPANNLATAPIFEFDQQEGASLDAMCEDLAAACPVELAKAIADQGSLTLLQPDFGPSAVTALGAVGGNVCGIAAAWGSLGADDCDKLARFVSFCDSFQLPLITLVHTPGFVRSSKEELAGSVRHAAKLAHVYAEATAAKITLVVGDAYGPAYIALAGRGAAADLVYAWPSAVISAVEPAAAVALLHEGDITAEKSRAQVEQEYRDGEASAYAAARGGMVDNVIAPADTRPVLVSALDILSSKRVTRLPKKHGNIPL